MSLFISSRPFVLTYTKYIVHVNRVIIRRPAFLEILHNSQLLRQSMEIELPLNIHEHSKGLNSEIHRCLRDVVERKRVKLRGLEGWTVDCRRSRFGQADIADNLRAHIRRISHVATHRE